MHGKDLLYSKEAGKNALNLQKISHAHNHNDIREQY